MQPSRTDPKTGSESEGSVDSKSHPRLRLGLQVKEPHQPNQIPQGCGKFIRQSWGELSVRKTKIKPYSPIVDKKENACSVSEEKENSEGRFDSGPPKATGLQENQSCKNCRKKIQTTRDLSDPGLKQSCENLWKKFKSSYNLSDPQQNHRTRGEVKKKQRATQGDLHSKANYTLGWECYLGPNLTPR